MASVNLPAQGKNVQQSNNFHTTTTIAINNTYPNIHVFEKNNHEAKHIKHTTLSETIESSNHTQRLESNATVAICQMALFTIQRLGVEFNCHIKFAFLKRIVASLTQQHSFTLGLVRIRSSR